MQQKTEKALEKLEKLIRDGEVGVSGFLPAERELCRRLGVGRGSLQTVLNELAARGLVCRIPGKGIKIAFRSDEEPWRKFLVVIQGNSINVAEQLELLRGVAAAADEQAAEIVLFFARNDFVDRRLTERLTDPSLDGIVFMEKFPPRIREAMTQSPLPYVVANFEGPEDVPAVRVDYRQVGRCAGRRLVEHGHRHIGFVGSDPGGSHIYREMFAGLKGALAEDDLVVDPKLTALVDTHADAGERKAAVLGMLRNFSGSGAIFAGRDHWAKLIFECCGELGVRIPEDLSVIGNDNVSWPEAEKAGLTSFTQPAYATGRAALDALCAARRSGRPVDTTMLMGDFIERTSVATR